jgi:hypothetical protein
VCVGGDGGDHDLAFDLIKGNAGESAQRQPPESTRDSGEGSERERERERER